MHDNIARLQEIIMIPAICMVGYAGKTIHDPIAKKIIYVIILCQLLTHLKMTVKPFRCNVNENKNCNFCALVAGWILFAVFRENFGHR